ncbi:MAG: methyltransferase domain-containing protein [bacterium]|nr:methyltransferase domain-containing protein [bacterium]
MHKSTPDEIRRRFDADVERFSNLETGQAAVVDSPLCMELAAQASAACAPGAKHALDIGCGAGNYALKMLESLPGLCFTLIDLSRPMLDRAAERLAAAGSPGAETIQGDIREIGLPAEAFDVIVAASVLHHLRGDEEWRAVFAKLYAALEPGGCLWIFDLIEHDAPALQSLMWRRYGERLTAQRGEAYRDLVFDYVEKEDTPRSVGFQLERLREAGFQRTEILHKNGCFALFGAIKSD